jgi:5-methylcytosine-specific restriction endonuclease McrA
VSEPTCPSPECRRCGTVKHYTGSRWRCSPCFNAWQTTWRAQRTDEQRKAATATQTANRRKWSPEQKAEANARVQAWRDADPERYLTGARDWYRRNAEYARAAKLAEYYREPEKFYARNLVRKARILAAVCAHGPKCVDAEFLKVLYASLCVYCSDPAEAADHFYPLARGGLHCIENIVPACGACNSHKSDRDPFEWLALMAS